MPASDPFPTLLARLQAGDPEAAAELVRRFSHRLHALARERLDPAMNPRLDAEDIVQSVYGWFFARLHAGELQFHNEHALRGLLILLAVHKCRERLRYHRAGRRDCRAEVGLPASAAARGPAPDETAILADLLEHLRRGMAPHEVTILDLQVQGHTLGEIAGRVGRSVRTVQRTIDRGRNRLKRLLAEGHPTPR